MVLICVGVTIICVGVTIICVGVTIICVGVTTIQIQTNSVLHPFLITRALRKEKTAADQEEMRELAVEMVSLHWTRLVERRD